MAHITDIEANFRRSFLAQRQTRQDLEQLALNLLALPPEADPEGDSLYQFTRQLHEMSERMGRLASSSGVLASAPWVRFPISS